MCARDIYIHTRACMQTITWHLLHLAEQERKRKDKKETQKKKDRCGLHAGDTRRGNRAATTSCCACKGQHVCCSRISETVVTSVCGCVIVWCTWKQVLLMTSFGWRGSCRLICPALSPTVCKDARRCCPARRTWPWQGTCPGRRCCNPRWTPPSTPPPHALGTPRRWPAPL